VSVRPVEFAARDGFKLGGTLYRPAQPNGRAVLVNGAVGVRQQFYSAFAAFLEERGFTVLTYDYRGIAASRHGHVRDLPARIRDWAQLDAPAALEELSRAAPGTQLLAVCHSFGVLCRWSGAAEAVLRGPEKGKCSGVLENVLTWDAAAHPWFRRFAEQLGPGGRLRVVENRLFATLGVPIVHAWLAALGSALPDRSVATAENVEEEVEFPRRGIPAQFH